jgi:hypothetical protein
VLISYQQRQFARRGSSAVKSATSIKDKLDQAAKQREELQRQMEEQEIEETAREELKSDPAYGYTEPR